MSIFTRKKQDSIFPIFCKLYGVSDPDYQGALAQTAESDHLQIVATERSVFVYSIPLNRVLGRLNDKVSETLKTTLGAEFCIDGIVENRTGGNGRLFGCNIRILGTRNMLKATRNIPLIE